MLFLSINSIILSIIWIITLSTEFFYDNMKNIGVFPWSEMGNMVPGQAAGERTAGIRQWV